LSFRGALATRNLNDFMDVKISPGACPERNSKIPRFARNDRSEGVEMTQLAFFQSSHFANAQLEEVSKLQETTLLLFWILAPEF